MSQGLGLAPGSTLLLTGATGFLGGHVARVLSEAGYRLRVLLRSTSDRRGLEGLDYEAFEGDVTRPETLPPALRGADGLVHMAGCTSFLPQDKRWVMEVNVGGTEQVLQAALEAGVTKVLFTSSLSAIGASEDPQRSLSEEARWDAPWANAYVRSKWLGEQAAWRAAEQGLELICVNPSILWGPGDRARSSTAVLLRFIEGEFPGYMRGGSGYADVRDVARGHLLAMQQGEPGRRYILSAANLRNQEVLDLAVQHGGAPERPCIPYAVALPLSFLNRWLVATWDRSKADFNPGLVRTGSRYWFADASRSEQELGLSYRPIEETLLDTLRWCLQEGILRVENPTLDALKQER